MAAPMKQLPRNVKTGPSRVPLCVADDADDSLDWDESYSVTPPPVAVSQEGSPVAPSSAAHPCNRSVLAIWTAVIVGVVVALGVTWAKTPQRQTAMALRSWVSDMPKVETSSLVRAQKMDLSSLARQRRADANLSHEGYASIPGGVLYTPESFSSSDGSYDLLLHFHGNVKVIVESAVASKLNAAVAVVNLGVGSGPYQDAYATPGTYEELLALIQSAVRRRGLENARLRRVALSAWSAGYGAISTILQQRHGADPLDAILVLDGIHTGYEDGHPGALVERRLASFEEAADAAASGELLFTVTYSEIDPPGYAGTRATAEHLLSVAKLRGEVEDSALSVPAYLKLVSMRGAVAKEDVRKLDPFSDRRVGSFRIRGYRGNTRGHHMAHLFQMGATVLPELAQRWDAYAGYTGRRDAVHASRVRMRARGKQPVR
jgi:hypothetical protein